MTNGRPTTGRSPLPMPMIPARSPSRACPLMSSCRVPAAEISAVVKFLNRHKIPYAVRGNGSSVMGFVMSAGAVIDLGRMKTIVFDEKNWLVQVGAGVAAFDLQKAAVERGFRVNVAEPAALVCANIMCSGIFSTFSASYGTAADNYIDAEFVGPDGERVPAERSGGAQSLRLPPGGCAAAGDMHVGRHPPPPGHCRRKRRVRPLRLPRAAPSILPGNAPCGASGWPSASWAASISRLFSRPRKSLPPR